MLVYETHLVSVIHHYLKAGGLVQMEGGHIQIILTLTFMGEHFLETPLDHK